MWSMSAAMKTTRSGEASGEAALARAELEGSTASLDAARSAHAESERAHSELAERLRRLSESMTRLGRDLSEADAQLATLHREYAAARLAALATAPDFLAQVREWLTSRLVQGVPPRAQVAQHFKLSERVFARRLQAQGAELIGFKDGKEVARSTGQTDKAELGALLDKAL